MISWALVLVMGTFTIKLSLNVWRLWKAGERVKVAETELITEKKIHEQLQQKLAEVESREFIEKEAREKLGLGTPIPTNNPPVSSQPQETIIKDEPNWQKWWKLYVGI